MTSPSQFINLDKQYGPESELFRQEWEEARKQRAQLVNDIATRLGLAKQLGSVDAADTAANTHEIFGQNADGSPTKYQASETAPNQHELNQLLGAAEVYGIANADKIPPQQLRQIIETRRLGAQVHSPTYGIGTPQWNNAMAASLGLAGAREMIGLAQSLPFVGDAIGRIASVRHADQAIARNVELIQSTVSPETASGLRYARAAGTVAGYVIPFEGVFRTLGLAGKLPFLAERAAQFRPFVRTFTKGALAAEILEGGNDHSIEDAAKRMAVAGTVSAGGEALFQDILPRVLEKVRSRFRAQTDSYYGYGGEGPLPPPGEEPAEWWFAGEQPSTGTSVTPYREPAPSPYGLPSGGPPALPPGGGGPLNPAETQVGLPAGHYEVPPQQIMSLPASTEQRNVVARATETDPLTSFGDRAALTKALENNNFSPSNSWVVFNGEQFKDIVKAHGASAGDQALSNFGVAIQRAAAELNIPPRLFRHATDEFAAIVPNDIAQQFADRASELSSQQVGVVSAKLQPIVSKTFNDANNRLLTTKSFVDEDAYWQGVKGTADLAPKLYDDPPIEPTRAFRRIGALMQRNDLDTQFLAGSQPELNSWMTSDPKFIYKQYANRGDPEGALNEYMQAERGARKIFADQFPENAALEVRQRLQFDAQAARAYPDVLAARLGVGPIRFAPKEAAAEASTLTKQATLIEAGNSNEILAKPELNELDVADAAMLKNGGGQIVIKNVGNPTALMQQVLRSSKTPQAWLPTHFQIVERNGSTDLILSDKEPITQKQIEQYKEFGFMKDQRATVNGRPVIILQPGAEKTATLDVKRRLWYVNTRDVMPGIGTELPPPRDAAKTYSEFKDYANAEMQKGFDRMGVQSPGDPWLSDETADQLPGLVNQFFRDNNINGELEQRTYESYFHSRRTDEIAALAPQEDRDLLDKATRELNKEANASPRLETTVESIAIAKGFRFIRDEDGVGGFLVDQNSELRIPVTDEDAAIEFLREINRELPDYSQSSSTPDELTDAGPHAANFGDPYDPTWQGGHEQYTESLGREWSRMQKALGDFMSDEEGAAGAAPPASPPPTPPAAVPPPSPPSGPRSSRTSTLAQQFQAANRSRPADVATLLRDLDSINLRMFEPFRRAALALEQRMFDIGIPEGKLWRSYEDISRSMDLKHNDEHPWLREASSVIAPFRSLFKRDGTVMKALLTRDPAQRTAYMVSKDFSQREMDAMQSLRELYQRFASNIAGKPTVDPADAENLFDYLRRVGINQGSGINNPYKTAATGLPGHFGFLPEFLEHHNFQIRQVDARTLTTQLVRGAMWQRHVAGPWQAMSDAWEVTKPASEIPTRLREEVGMWLDTVKYGHNPGWDPTIQGVRHILNFFGVPVTNSEVSRGWNWAFGNFYRAKLGGDPAVIFRDSISPWLAGVRIGFAPVTDAYARFFTNPTERAAMIQRGLKGGWLQEGAVKVPISEVFESPIVSQQGVSLLPPTLEARRQSLANIGDKIYDILPERLRQPIQGTVLDPLLPYTKLNEMNRVVAGDAGWHKAAKALAEYQNNISTDPMNFKKHMGQLMWDSAADVYPPPIQRSFQDLVNNAKYDAAANLMGNEAANSQGRYGTRESSIAIRRAGNVGRMGMTFGSFTQQYVAWMRESFGSYVPVAKRAAMATRYSGFTAVLGLAGAYTGWNFGKWMWHQSLSFAGGPWAQAAYQEFQNVSGRIAEATGQSLSPQQSDAVSRSRATSLSDDISSAPLEVFPYQRTLRAAGDFYSSVRGLNPVEATARRALTGEAGLGPDFRQVLQLPVVSPSDLEGAIAGQSEARAKFSPEELQVVDRLRHVPRAQQWRAWASYRDATRMQSTFPPSGGSGNRQ